MYAASTESAELNSIRPFEVSLYYLCCLFWVCWLFSINSPFCPDFSLHLNVSTWLPTACLPQSREPNALLPFLLGVLASESLQVVTSFPGFQTPDKLSACFPTPTSACSRPNSLRVLLCPCASLVMFASGLPLTLGHV